MEAKTKKKQKHTHSAPVRLTGGKFSSCTNHLPKRVMAGVAVLAAAAAGSPSAERYKQVQSWPSCSSTFRDESDARGPARGSLPPRGPPLRAASFLLHSVLSGLQLWCCNF